MVQFALNHMTVARLGFAELVALAADLGCVGIEVRNDLPQPLFDGMDPAEAGALARFEPLAAEDARLTLADGRITADAVLRAPASRRSVAEVTIAHDLATASGNAQLRVPGVVFDKAAKGAQAYMAFAHEMIERAQTF